VHLLDQPHHDGSPDFIGAGKPRLGRAITLRVRTSVDDDVRRIWVRSLRDGEPHFDEARVERRVQGVVWWTARVLVRNPVLRYRFQLDGASGVRWLNGSGVHQREVPDTDDFYCSTHDTGPDWAREAVVYQIFPDRFARSALADRRPAPDWARAVGWDARVLYRDPIRRARQLFGGDLDGIREHLDHVADLGADVVYLTPIFRAPSNHRYDAMSFEEVDPVLGGNPALARLSRAVHRRGMRIVGDVTTNHTGRLHPWFVSAMSDPASPYRAAYYFDGDSSRYEGWLGVKTLPKLNFGGDLVMSRMVTDRDSTIRSWLRPPYRLDGWRIDVANMTGRHVTDDYAHAVSRAVRAAACDVRRNALVVAEHTNDATVDLNIGGWHGTMNYAGFARPIWGWLMQAELDFHTPPLGTPPADGTSLVTALVDFGAKYGWRSRLTSWNLLGSHDSPRIRTVAGTGSRQRVGAGMLFTMPGTPMVFAGDEIGLEGITGEDARRTMPWHDRSRWDQDTLAAYRSLIRLRRTYPALVSGSLRWAHVGRDVVAYLRELGSERLLCVASRSSARPFSLPAAALGLRSGRGVYGAADRLRTDGDRVRVGVPGEGFRVWRL
jgi:alpha-glucosidase